MWKEIKNYEGIYEINEYGIVRSIDRYIIKSNGVKQFKKGRIIIPSLNRYGYYQLKLCKNGKQTTYKIHQLVAQTFLQYPNDGNIYEVNHIDCIRTNNHVSNLEYLTHYDNVHYAITMNNHICTKDLTGINNPNYHNDTLKIYYQTHPEMKQSLSKPREKNGMSKEIDLYDINNNFVKHFTWIGECAEYLIKQEYTKSRNINAIRDRITKSIRTNKPYLNHFYKFTHL